MLVGNKLDLTHKRTVSKVHGETLAKVEILFKMSNNLHFAYSHITLCQVANEDSDFLEYLLQLILLLL